MGSEDDERDGTEEGGVRRELHTVNPGRKPHARRSWRAAHQPERGRREPGGFQGLPGGADCKPGLRELETI